MDINKEIKVVLDDHEVTFLLENEKLNFIKVNNVMIRKDDLDITKNREDIRNKLKESGIKPSSLLLKIKNHIEKQKWNWIVNKFRPKKSIKKSVKKSVKKSLKKSLKKSPKKSVKKSMKSKTCKERLSEKIAINISEGKYKSKEQAIAVAYSQVKKMHPNFIKYLQKK